MYNYNLSSPDTAAVVLGARKRSQPIG